MVWVISEAEYVVRKGLPVGKLISYTELLLLLVTPLII